MDEKNFATKKHEIHIKNREEIQINGVDDVLSFDAEEIILNTTHGLLMLRGTNLHVSELSLDSGEVKVDGTFLSVTYSEKNTEKTSGGFFERLFR